FARPRTGGIEGADDGREGHVTVLDAKTNAVVGTITLPPLADTGFLSNGTTLGGVPLRTNPDGSDVFDTRTGAFPNQLRSIVIRGDRAYLPNIGASPNGPFRFNVNLQSLLNVVDVGTNADSGQTINMNSGVQNEGDATQLFITNPFAVAFDHRKT